MSTLELKTSFHQLIDKVDENILSDLYDTFNQYLNTNPKVLAFDDKSPARLARIKQAMESAERGDYITTDELRKKFKEWNTK
jgi:hypothetical protein